MLLGCISGQVLTFLPANLRFFKGKLTIPVRGFVKVTKSAKQSKTLMSRVSI